jgi:hypothetical protein
LRINIDSIAASQEYWLFQLKDGGIGMASIQKLIAPACATLALGAIVPAAAQADPGLLGAYYADVNVGSVADEIAAIASRTPTATFTATTVCFPSCANGVNYDDSGTLAGFLGANATGLSNNVSGVSSHAIKLTGYFKVAADGYSAFSLGSDDGSQLFIDGNLVVNNDFPHGVQYASNGAYFLGAGLHQITIYQFEGGGQTALQAFMNGSAIGADAFSTSAPEPGSWALMLGGFGAIGLALRRRPAARFA